MNEMSEKITCSSLSQPLEAQQDHGRCPIIWSPSRYDMKTHHCGHENIWHLGLQHVIPIRNTKRPSKKGFELKVS
jgi:hypothetical protein